MSKCFCTTTQEERKKVWWIRKLLADNVSGIVPCFWRLSPSWQGLQSFMYSVHLASVLRKHVHRGEAACSEFIWPTAFLSSISCFDILLDRGGPACTFILLVLHPNITEACWLVIVTIAWSLFFSFCSCWNGRKKYIFLELSAHKVPLLIFH